MLCNSNVYSVKRIYTVDWSCSSQKQHATETTSWQQFQNAAQSVSLFITTGSFSTHVFYPHMPIGKVWIYRLLFVLCVFFVCTVTDFSGEDKASGVKFCTEVHRRPGREISHFGELCSPRSPKFDTSARGKWT